MVKKELSSLKSQDCLLGLRFFLFLLLVRRVLCRIGFTVSHIVCDGMRAGNEQSKKQLKINKRKFRNKFRNKARNKVRNKVRKRSIAVYFNHNLLHLTPYGCDGLLRLGLYSMQRASRPNSLKKTRVKFHEAVPWIGFLESTDRNNVHQPNQR